MPIGDVFFNVMYKSWDIQANRRREILSPRWVPFHESLFFCHFLYLCSNRALLGTLGQKYDQYLDFAQQDAHEFLRILLDAMRMEEQDVSFFFFSFRSLFRMFLLLTNLRFHIWKNNSQEWTCADDIYRLLRSANLHLQTTTTRNVGGQQWRLTTSTTWRTPTLLRQHQHPQAPHQHLTMDPTPSCPLSICSSEADLHLSLYAKNANTSLKLTRTSTISASVSKLKIIFLGVVRIYMARKGISWRSWQRDWLLSQVVEEEDGMPLRAHI